MTHFFGHGGIGGFLGRELSLKNLVPLALTVVGGAVGSLIPVPGLGTAIGAGVGDYLGNEIEGRTGGQSLRSGLEAGALAYAGDELGGAAGSALSGTEVGNALSSLGQDWSSSELGQAVSGIGSDISSGASSLGADFGLGAGAGVGAGADVGAAAGSSAVDASAGGAAATVGSGGGTLLGNAVNEVGSDIGLGGSSGGTLLGNAINSGWSDLTGGAAAGAAAPTTGSLIAHTGAGLTAPAATAAVDPALASAAGAAGSGASSGLFGGGGDGLLKAAIAGAPIALAALRGNQEPAGYGQIQGEASNLNSQGQALAGYLESGTLPPGAQQAINAAAGAAAASVRSQYASMGDAGSSAEAQDLAAVQEQAVAQSTNLATQLLSTGIQEQEASAGLYTQIMNESLAQDQDLSTAIGNFAAAAVGTGNGPANDNRGASLNVAL